MKKKKYDTGVILLYLLGKEHFLPKAFRKSIPYSTISSWRKTDHTSYEGHQFRFLFEEDWDSLIERERRIEAEGQLRSVAKVWLLHRERWKDVINEARADTKLQRKILRCVRYLRETFGLAKTLKLLGLSAALYQQWSTRERHSCPASVKALCLRRHPNQLRREEIKK